MGKLIHVPAPLHINEPHPTHMMAQPVFQPASQVVASQSNTLYVNLPAHTYRTFDPLPGALAFYTSQLPEVCGQCRINDQEMYDRCWDRREINDFIANELSGIVLLQPAAYVPANAWKLVFVDYPDCEKFTEWWSQKRLEYCIDVRRHEDDPQYKGVQAFISEHVKGGCKTVRQGPRLTVYIRDLTEATFFKLRFG